MQKGSEEDQEVLSCPLGWDCLWLRIAEVGEMLTLTEHSRFMQGFHVEALSTLLFRWPSSESKWLKGRCIQEPLGGASCSRPCCSPHLCRSMWHGSAKAMYARA